MFKKEVKFMLLITLVPIVVGLLAALIGPVLFKGTCNNSVIEEISSPGNNYKCVVFTRDCGATTGYDTQVSVLSEDKKLDNNSGNIFIADTDHGKAPSGPGGGPDLHITWENEKNIVVRYNSAARVFKSEGSYNGIHIKHQKIK